MFMIYVCRVYKLFFVNYRPMAVVYSFELNKYIPISLKIISQLFDYFISMSFRSDSNAVNKQIFRHV